MLYPAFTVPQAVAHFYALNRYKTTICQNELSFCDTRQFGNLTLLPQMSVFAVLDDWDTVDPGC